MFSTRPQPRAVIPGERPLTPTRAPAPASPAAMAWLEPATTALRPLSSICTAPAKQTPSTGRQSIPFPSGSPCTGRRACRPRS